MVSSSDRVNRGPAAAAGNRQAIMDSARVLLRRQGYSVPLSAIARRAGVSQGVLYRHFRNRSSLAFAVFEENFEVLEEIASREGEYVIYELWDRLLDYAVTDHGFVELLLSSDELVEEYDGMERLQKLISPALKTARAAGTVPDNLTSDMVAVAWRMGYGISALSLRGEGDVELLREILTLPKIAALFAP